MNKILTLFALVLLLLAGLVVYAFWSTEMRAGIFEMKLSSIKDADYSLQISSLMQEERYEEADKLAAYVLANPDMPSQERVRDLRAELAGLLKKDRSPLKRGMDLIGGFLSGGGSSVEERLGGLLSNILLSNTGLSESDLPKKRPDDGSDKLSSALERANLGNDGRWFPAVIRTLRTSGLLSAGYETFLSENASASIASGQPTQELEAAVANTRALVSAMGLGRALGVHKEIRDGRDLAQLVEWGRASPDATYVVAYRGGMDVFYRLSPPPAGTQLLETIARKGQPAIDAANFWLRPRNQ